MATLFVYILKASACLAFFYLFYRLLLSKETFHRFNRSALLGVLLLAWILPMIKFTLQQPTEIGQTIMTIEQLLAMSNWSGDVDAAAHTTMAMQGSYVSILLYAFSIIYIIGLLFFASRQIYGLLRVRSLIKKSHTKKLANDVTLCVHEMSVSPFSWMRCIVISEKDLAENGREILIHENAHILHKHSWDLLLADIAIILQWFNPAAWLLKQELQAIHEYQADDVVLKEGVDAKQYQLLLIKKAVGTRLYSMANSFNQGNLKKRITMMLKEKSNPLARFKYLYILPLAALTVTAFASPEISVLENEISSAKINDLVAINEVPQEENVLKTVQVSAEEVAVTNKEASSLGADKGKSKSTSANTPDQSARPLVLLDGKEISYDRMKAMDNNEIESVVVLKDEQATSVYGAKGKNGVIVISSKTSQDNKPLVFINGKEVSNEVMSALNPESIENITVLKGQNAINAYGEKGKNGVIEVTLKSSTNMSVSASSTSELVVRGHKENQITTEQPVKGIVKNSKGEPVVGAAVIINGTTQGTVTDSKGQFTINGLKGNLLKISYPNMKTATVEGEQGKAISVTLQSE